MDNLIDKEWYSKKAKTKMNMHREMSRQPPFPEGKTRLDLELLLVKLRANSKKAKLIREQLRYWGDVLDRNKLDGKGNTGINNERVQKSE